MLHESFPRPTRGGSGRLLALRPAACIFLGSSFSAQPGHVRSTSWSAAKRHGLGVAWVQDSSPPVSGQFPGYLGDIQEVGSPRRLIRADQHVTGKRRLERIASAWCTQEGVGGRSLELVATTGHLESNLTGYGVGRNHWPCRVYSVHARGTEEIGYPSGPPVGGKALV